jgi:DNA-binding NarL/FixJ family response regulator
VPSSGIVVVDDCKEWRRTICSLLQTRPELRIIAEATDGVDGVQKADELKPDLIVLDIGLPRLNGIEAAKLISEVSPVSKILFLSGVDDPDVEQVALATGASAYVYKCNAATELLSAVLAILRGSPRKSYESSSGVMESTLPNDRSAVSAVCKSQNPKGHVAFKTAATHDRSVQTLESDDPWFTRQQSGGSSSLTDLSED